ncbi:MAG: 50S ribosomal protein L18 [Bernardetiaceae bacterium]|nr:50S ribosomal protein L18 [Bernardetiaceae bacterium]
MALSKKDRRWRIRRRVRRKIQGTAERPRLSIFRSNKAIYAQIIDDVKGHTLASASLWHLTKEQTLNKELSTKVGKLLAERATEKGVKSVVFDRSGYLYAGNIKALAEGAREGGLEF